MDVEPGHGEDVVVDAQDDDVTNLPTDSAPDLLLYRILHDEVRDRISHHYRSLLSGLSVVGIVIAYALLSGEFVFLAVVPVVIGFLVVQTVRQLNGILYIARHLNRIERAFVDDHPLFAWEHRYGMTGTERRVERWGINWSHVPQGIVIAFAVLGYVGFIYIAYVVWPPAGVDVLAVGLTRVGLLWIYALLTVLVSLSGYSYYLHRTELGSPEE